MLIVIDSAVATMFIAADVKIDDENEKKVYDYLLTLLKKQMSQFTTSIQVSFI